MAQQEDVFKKLVAHCKEYGFVFPSSEIYDGLAAVYDYGQNGVELKNNIKKYWWDSMWQASGKYVPRVDQLTKIAPVIIDMGCFARVETNGGAFEQVNLLFGENPNKAVREWTKPFNDVGIQTHMFQVVKGPVAGSLIEVRL